MSKPDKVVATVVDSRKQSDRTDEYRRQSDGRFGAGNPGKPLGANSRQTVKMEMIREAIVGSWDGLADNLIGLSGHERLMALADKDFEAYLFAISRFMPKGAQVLINIPMFVTADPALHSEATTKFIDSIEKRADGGMPSPSMVLAALKEASNKNGKANGRANGRKK